MASRVIRNLLGRAGITVDGANPWDIRVTDERFYLRVLREKSLGLGESYMDGWWECPRIDEMLFRLLRSGIEHEVSGSLRHALREVPWLLFNLQSKARAHIVAERHYDLGNELFFSFLDPYKQYSCAYFDGTDDLGAAQLNKLALIAGKLSLSPGDQLLDIGCGWGGLARYAAEQRGCEVTGVNISQEQLGFARELCAGLPVSFMDRDYRSITGSFDKVVSVGMFEHVGPRNHEAFMEVVRRCLKDDGIFLLHTIGDNAHRRGGSDAWIAKHIFPNGMLPTVAQIAKAAEGRFVIEDWHNLFPSYDRTLMAWNKRFQAAWPRLCGQYDERFKRMWEYYLLSCAAAFRARHVQIWQIVMTRHGSGTPKPRCRGVPGRSEGRTPSDGRG